MGSFVQDRLHGLDAWQRRHPVVAVPYAVVKKFGEDGAGNLAALVAYYSFLSLFPLLLVFVTVVGFTLDDRPDLQQQILDSALAQFPVIGDQLRSNVTGVQGSGLALVIGLVVALWAGLGATTAMQNAMHAVWRVPMRERTGFIGSRLRSLGLLVVIGGFVAATVVLSSVATAAAGLGVVGRVGLLVLALAGNVLLFLVAFLLLGSRDAGWRALLPGAALAGAAWLVLQSLGTVYVQHVVSGASQTYGAFAVVIGLVSYLYLQAQITVYAAELNTVLAGHLWPRSIVAADLTAADRDSLVARARVEERVEGQRIDVDLREPQHA